MKLLILHRKLVQGGAERQLVALVDGLTRRGHEAVVLTFYGGGPLEADLLATGARLVDLGKSGRWDVGPFLLRLARALRRERPDVVKAYLPFQNTLLSLLRPVHGAKVVWALSSSANPARRRSKMQVIDRWLERTLRRTPDAIVPNSFAGRDHARALGFPDAKMTVIANGVDTEVFRRDEAGRARLRAEWGVGEGELLVGRVGRLDVQKDYATGLRAVALLAETHPNVRFAAVGRDAGEEASLRRLAEELGIARRVVWVGTRQDMAAVYSAMDVHLSTSRYSEGTPNVVGEAMACGVPCVVTDVGDCARAAGPLGLVVPPRDPAAMAAALGETADRLARGEVDRDALRGFVLERFSLEELVRRTEAVLLGVVAGERRSRRIGATPPASDSEAAR